ncbi:MAG: chorismate mutase [Bacteroidales bacterium]|nr:chorismate mutase [Bacteroidales bacterium]
METLEEIRARIDEVDERMAELLAERIALAKQAAKFKRANGLPAEDPLREQQILEHGATVFEKGMEKELGPDAAEAAREDYLRFQKTVFRISKQHQQ